MIMLPDAYMMINEYVSTTECFEDLINPVLWSYFFQAVVPADVFTEESFRCWMDLMTLRVRDMIANMMEDKVLEVIAANEEVHPYAREAVSVLPETVSP